MIDVKAIEENILAAAKAQFSYCCTQDEVNKVYRQSRNWVRYHCHFGKACSDERGRELNQKFKEMRWKRLSELGYEVKGGGTWRR